MSHAPFRWLEHTADIRAQITGRTLREFFQHAAWALADALTDRSTIRTRSRRVAPSARRLRVSASDREMLLVGLLKEILFLFEARRFLTHHLVIERLVVEKRGQALLIGRAVGETFDPARHRLKTEIKAVTYHGLQVKKVRNRWQAEVVFDV